ncbi:YVTN family beta-propeller protein [Nocardioides daedukensis]|uniref:YVTN family beta-propeller protein n=1 Tax=Nocardioides daedukensis TaxID=634462 RepID=A0A7Y9RXC1_9ACTN|nr:YVTN family beta-propeller protein [Nocardioides daedukensis]
MRRTTGLCALLAAAVLGTGFLTADPGRGVSAEAAAPAPSTQRDVMFVGNNWAGTATVVDARTYKPIKTINIVPDKQQELKDIYLNPVRLLLYLAVQQVVAEGHDQLVDDMFTTPDGNLVAVSRPSFGDVVWIDLATNKIVAEQQMDGFRTDHMQVSPDGKRLLVSDSTSKQVIEFALGGRGQSWTGKRIRTFTSGETPHESNYTKDGERIFHASIGRVYTPLDAGELGPLGDLIKADRWFQIVRNSDFKVLKRWDMGKELAEYGLKNMSSAVRPMAISPDERYVYLQVSFFHGFVVFDTQAKDANATVDYTLGGLPEPRTGKVIRTVNLRQSEAVKKMLREQYTLDSAHHGLAIDRTGKKLCVAGTMSDYAALVSTDGKQRTYFEGGSKPYWATTSPFNNTCWVSMSGTDQVFVIDYATRKVIRKIPVGTHPQRVREGHLSVRVQQAWGK